MIETSVFLPPLIQQIYNEDGVEVYVLRLDLMHSWVNGNKWFKLKYNLLEAKERDFSTILTFGGAFSNHIFATAAAGKVFGFDTIGVIRGEETLPLNPTLDFARKQGMQLVYLDRTTYRQRNTRELQESLKQRYGQVFIIPEGGCNLNGIRGCMEIARNLRQFDTICLACGTGTTLAGIILSLHPQQRVIGFPVLKSGEFLYKDINSLLQDYFASDLPASVDSPAVWDLVCDYHFGGYAQVNEELRLFCKSFLDKYNIPLDYVYTGKMFYGVMDLIKKGFFQNSDRCSQILLIHTGGLQGNIGLQK